MPIMSDGDSPSIDHVTDNEVFDDTEGFFVGPSSIDSRTSIEYSHDFPYPESQEFRRQVHSTQRVTAVNS